MAYITQKQFLQPSFWNEDPKLPSRKRSEGVLKSYSSCSDTRAWSLDLQKQSQFITDVAHRVLSQAGKVPLHSFSGAELTKDYLVRLDADSLADYILSLRGETKRNAGTIERLNETKTNLSNQNEVLSQRLGVLEQENRQLHDEIERIGRCQEQQKATNTFDEEELIEISKQIFDLSERNEDLEDEIRDLRFQLNARQPAESSHGDHGEQQAVLEAENNFLKFKSHEYEKLESELCLFKAEFDSLKQQKRELTAEVQRLQRYRVRSVELKKELTEELQNRELCEEQIEMLVNMYEQQSVELNQLKDQIKSHTRRSEDDESVDGNNDSKVSVVEPRSVQGEGQNLTSQPCQSCAEYARQTQQLEEQIQNLQQQQQQQQQQQVIAASASIYESQHAETADTSVLELQLEDLQRELNDCEARLKEANEQYASLRESSLADCQELGRLKLQLDQMAREEGTTSDASKLTEFEDKLKALQEENETLRNQQTKDQPTDGSSKCCPDKEKQIAELQQTISRLQLATSEGQQTLAELETVRVKNVTLEQRITALEKQLETADQRANEVQRALDAQLSGQPGGERLSACLTELTTEKNETIERLKEELESLQTANATLESELHACQNERQELRNMLKPKGTAADAEEEAETMVQDAERDVLLSPKEELASLVDEKEGDVPEPEAVASGTVGDDVPEAQDACASELEALFVVKQVDQRSRSRSVDRCKRGNGRVIHALAVKIVNDGIEVLLVAELYVLLREVCSVIAHKNAILGRNVTVLANSMSECWQVITDARVMMDKEIERTEPMVPRGDGIDVRVTCHAAGGHRCRASRQSGAVPLHQTRSAESDEFKQFPTNLETRRSRCTMKWKELPGAKRTNR